MPPAGSTSTSGANPPHSRARPQGARKKAMAADDAAYHGASSVNAAHAGTKRSAVDKADGEPRNKRKRVEPTSMVAATSGSSQTMNGRKVGDKPESEGRLSLIDFTTLSTETVHRYLVQFDLIPEVDPLPTGALDPPPPSSLLRPRGQRNSSSSASPPPITLANRPRREQSTSTTRRRSARLLEEDQRHVVPVLADIGDVHSTLAQLAERHFREHTVKEVDTLASFMFAIRAQARMRG